MKLKTTDRKPGERSSGNAVTRSSGARAPREGWEAAFSRLPVPEILAEPAPTEFDREEWTWR